MEQTGKNKEFVIRKKVSTMKRKFKVKIGTTSVKMLLDTGSGIAIINEKNKHRINYNYLAQNTQSYLKCRIFS